MAFDVATVGFDGAAWGALLDGPARQALERECLAPFLARQRWFAGKARVVSSVRVADWGVLAAGDDPSFLVLADVDYADGGRDRYFLPLATASGSAATAIERDAPARIVARVAGARAGVLHDELADDVAPALLETIAGGRHCALRHGTVHARPTRALAALRRHDRGRLRARRAQGEQSNTSLVFGDRLILKLIRRVEPGLNPDFEVGHHLTERVGFDRAPRLAGSLHYEGGGERAVLGVMHEFVPHDGGAWDYTLDQVRRFFDRVRAVPRAAPAALTAPPSLLALAGSTPPPLVRETVGGYLDGAARLGRCTAELHAALATPAGDPAFEPERLTGDDCAHLAETVQRQAATALDVLAGAVGRMPGPLADAARTLIRRRDALLAACRQAAGLPPGVSRIRVHGDYHLGQVLYAGGDFVVLDFEGEPLRPIEERRRKHPAFKDVAGMLRSFGYAAHAALFARTADEPHEVGELEPWARLWETWASASFLAGYLRTPGAARWLPPDPAARDVLLRVYLLDKACYELVYELNNRPDWLRIPLLGLLSLVEPA